MPITEKQRRWLKQRAHHLKPVVLLGQHGLTEPVLNELQGALDHHELIKVRIAADDRDQRAEIVARIAERTAAVIVQRIGNTATFYRHNPDRPHGLRFPPL